jgi:hypothetical protein
MVVRRENGRLENGWCTKVTIFKQQILAPWASNNRCIRIRTDIIPPRSGPENHSESRLRLELEPHFSDTEKLMNVARKGFGMTKLFYFILLFFTQEGTPHILRLYL